MKIAIGADHAGFLLKDKLRDQLRAAGHDTPATLPSAQSTKAIQFVSPASAGPSVLTSLPNLKAAPIDALEQHQKGQTQ